MCMGSVLLIRDPDAAGQPSGQLTATFTGTMHLDPVLTAPGVMVNTVIFTPGARRCGRSGRG